jgi:polyhydroxybutyrate depolymerase
VPPHGTDDVAFIAKLVENWWLTAARSKADLRHRDLQWRRDDHDAGLQSAPNCSQAAATVVINLTDQSANPCRPSRPVPMLMMNGTADPWCLTRAAAAPAALRSTASGRRTKPWASGARANGCER